jgi:hypothetical protein
VARPVRRSRVFEPLRRRGRDARRETSIQVSTSFEAFFHALGAAV